MRLGAITCEHEIEETTNSINHMVRVGKCIVENPKTVSDEASQVGA